MGPTLQDVLAAAAAIREGADDVVGDDPKLDPVPHTDDFWISTDDAGDYARWLDRRVKEADAVYLRALSGNTEAPPEAAGRWSLEWVPFVTRWRAYFVEHEASWWSRVNSWDRLAQYHQELRALVAKGQAMGLPLGPVDEVPRDLDAVKALARDTGEAIGEVAAPAGLLLGVVGLVALAVLLKR